MAKSRRFTIEFLEREPNNLYGAYDNNNRFDTEGKGTRVEMCVDSGTDETGGCQTTWEYKKGHISADEAAKMIRNMINGSDTKKKFLFKSLSGIALFNKVVQD